jgi:hypothetical protein
MNKEDIIMRLLPLAFIVAMGGISLATFATSETLHPTDIPTMIVE